MELRELAVRVGEVIIRGLGTRSLWALRWTLDAAENDGVAARCMITVPAKTKDFVEFQFIPDFDQKVPGGIA